MAVAFTLADILGKASPPTPPERLPISLGLCEPQIANALAWRDALDDVFAVAGGAGISVLVSAGDQGSTGCRGHFAETLEEISSGSAFWSKK